MQQAEALAVGSTAVCVWKPPRHRLGASELSVPALGVGTASWGSRLMGYGRSYGRDDVLAAYRACLDAGLDLFDTAESYADGDSERLLGECRRADGRPSLIATKYSAAGPFGLSKTPPSASSLLRALDGSLARLGVDRVDLLQVHYPTRPEIVDALMDGLAQAARSGKVRAVGVSNYGVALTRRAHARLAEHGVPLASNQVRYNLLHRRPEHDGLLEACRELDIALIAYSPMEQGVLIGKYRDGVLKPSASQAVYFRLPQLDLFGEPAHRAPLARRLLAKPRALRRARLEPLFETLDAIAAARGATLAQVALSWLICGQDCVLPIPGAKTLAQAREIAAAAGLRLTAEERARITQAEELSYG